MSRVTRTEDAWHPQTRFDREAILLELQSILASPHFSNSKRYPALLQYVVEKTLDGESDSLKERTLGVEVFDRPPAYDTNADTIVRYTAGEVRKRLSLYYHDLPKRAAIQILLPAGSYVPEFIQAHEEPPPFSPERVPGEVPHVSAPVGGAAGARVSRRSIVLGVALMVAAVAGLAGWLWQSHRGSLPTPLSRFWGPVLRDQPAVLMCAGGSVFAQNDFSGVETAGKDVQYPFVSMQSASAIAQISGLVEASGSVTRLQGAAATPLNELRERSVILLGGYNNPWTIRLVEPLRFHFSPASDASPAIIDSTQPGVRWQRNHALGYSNADDYALIARFHNTVTDGWVVALAGIGRNGTEGAAQFVSSPRYMELLRQRVGSELGNRNVEVVLKLNVIDGKTGAPTIQAVYVW